MEKKNSERSLLILSKMSQWEPSCILSPLCLLLAPPPHCKHNAISPLPELVVVRASEHAGLENSWWYWWLKAGMSDVHMQECAAPISPPPRLLSNQTTSSLLSRLFYHFVFSELPCHLCLLSPPVFGNIFIHSFIPKILNILFPFWARHWIRHWWHYRWILKKKKDNFKQCYILNMYDLSSFIQS